MHARTLRSALPLVALLATAATAFAGTIHVPKDQPTIQAASDAAVDGDTILISSGTYAKTITISYRQQLVVRAAGKVTIESTGATGLLVSGCTDVQLIGLRFHGGSGAGVSIATSSFVTLSKCRIEGFDGDGVKADQSHHVRLDRCTVRDIGGVAIGLPHDAGGSDCAGSLVTHCIVSDLRPDSDALRVFGNGSVVEDCKLTGAPSAVEFGRASTSGGTLRHDHFTATPITIGEDSCVVRDGVFLDAPMTLNGASVLVQHNTCAADDPPISLLASDGVIDGNHLKLTGNGIAALNVVDATGSRLTGNVIPSSAAEGISIFSSDFLVIESNVITKAEQEGVDFEDCVGAVVRHCVFKGCGISGIRCDASSTLATIESNVITGPSAEGIRVTGADGLLILNTVKGCTFGFHLDANATGNVLSQNTAKGNSDADLLNDAGGANLILGDNNFGTTSP